MEKDGWVHSSDSLAFVEDFINALTCIPLCSNDVALVQGFCLNLLQKWKSMVSPEIDNYAEKTNAIEKLDYRLKILVSYFDFIN